MTINEQLERQIIKLNAMDRIEIPVSSLSGKLKRMKPKFAGSLDLPNGKYLGERVYARFDREDGTEKARTMREAVDWFAKEHPTYGKILNDMIDETRESKDISVYFGVNEGCRLTAEDYVGVMVDIGFTETQAMNLYEPLMDVSRKMSRARDEERSVLIS